MAAGIAVTPAGTLVVFTGTAAATGEGDGGEGEGGGLAGAGMGTGTGTVVTTGMTAVGGGGAGEGAGTGASTGTGTGTGLAVRVGKITGTGTSTGATGGPRMGRDEILKPYGCTTWAQPPKLSPTSDQSTHDTLWLQDSIGTRTMPAMPVDCQQCWAGRALLLS